MGQNRSYQEQLGRLINYAKGLGVTVYFRTFKKGDPSAEWTLDGKDIVVYVKNRQPKLRTILCLIHELGHHLDHIYGNNREYNHRLANAIDSIDKKSRKIVLQSELDGMKYWHTVYKDTNMTFPVKRLDMEMEFDKFYYEYWNKYGKEPTTKILKEYSRKLRAKYRYKLRN